METGNDKFFSNQREENEAAKRIGEEKLEARTKDIKELMQRTAAIPQLIQSAVDKFSETLKGDGYNVSRISYRNPPILPLHIDVSAGVLTCTIQLKIDSTVEFKIEINARRSDERNKKHETWASDTLTPEQLADHMLDLVRQLH